MSCGAMLKRIGIALCLLPAPAFACPDGAETLVSCTIDQGAKRLETCLMGNYASYAFGPADRGPDLHLARPVTQIEMTPWPGVGRAIWEDFTFYSGLIAYRVHYSFDRNDGDAAELQGGVDVLQGETVLASLSCDVGSVLSSGYGLPLFDAKIAAGQNYSPETYLWE